MYGFGNGTYTYRRPTGCPTPTRRAWCRTTTPARPGCSPAATSLRAPAARRGPQPRRCQRHELPRVRHGLCRQRRPLPDGVALSEARFRAYDEPSRFSEWNREFQLMLQQGQLDHTAIRHFRGRHVPQFMTVRLMKDHTQGVSAGRTRPRPRSPTTTTASASSSRPSAKARSGIHGDLHRRGRRAGRAGPRGQPPVDGLRDQPLDQAELGGPHVLQHRQHAPHDGVDPGSAADEPVRRRRDPDPRLRHRPEQQRAVPGPDAVSWSRRRPGSTTSAARSTSSRR